jgi:hypothetical protein
VFTQDSLVGRRSSDAGKLQVNWRILITSNGDRAVADSSARQLLRNQEFATDTLLDAFRTIRSRYLLYK